MTEEDIGSSGRFSALNATEVTTSYQPSASTALPSVTSTPAAPAMAGSAASITEERPTQQPTTREVDTAVAAANANIASTGRMLDYTVDSTTGIYVALIRNSQTGEVLQQIPGADLLALARLLADWTPGKHMLLDLEA